MILARNRSRAPLVFDCRVAGVPRLMRCQLPTETLGETRTMQRALAVIIGCTLALLLEVDNNARADVIAWDEGVNGSFSHDRLNPTPVTFVVGVNDIFGNYGRSVAGGDVNPDYFTFNIPAGESLTAITVLPGTTSTGPLNDSFIGLEAGRQITLPPTTTTAAGLLGWFHFGPDDINTDILPLMAIPAQGSSGFTIPLGPGDYAVWVQETGVCAPTLCTYALAFTVVPEPASSVGVLTGLVALAAMQRRRRRLGN
jgi:hypothetical protein